jgi:hypothetical protein
MHNPSAKYSLLISLVLHVLGFKVFWLSRNFKLVAHQDRPSVKVRILSHLPVPKFRAQGVKPQVLNGANTKTIEQHSKNTDADAPPKKNWDRLKFMPSESSVFETPPGDMTTSSHTPQHSLDSDQSFGTAHGLGVRSVDTQRQRKLDSIASSWDVPLIWRKGSQEAYAKARVELKSDGKLAAIKVSGEPLLRALLWKGMREPTLRDFIFQKLADSTDRELTIVLRFVNRVDSYRGLNTEVMLFDRGMLITKTLPPIQRAFGGMALSDRHAALAKAKDREQLRKMEEWPGFQAEIVEVDF